MLNIVIVVIAVITVLKLIFFLVKKTSHTKCGACCSVIPRKALICPSCRTHQGEGAAFTVGNADGAAPAEYPDEFSKAFPSFVDADAAGVKHSMMDGVSYSKRFVKSILITVLISFAAGVGAKFFYTYSMASGVIDKKIHILASEIDLDRGNVILPLIRVYQDQVNAVASMFGMKEDRFYNQDQSYKIGGWFGKHVFLNSNYYYLPTIAAWPEVMQEDLFKTDPNLRNLNWSHGFRAYVRDGDDSVQRNAPERWNPYHHTEYKAGRVIDVVRYATLRYLYGKEVAQREMVVASYVRTKGYNHSEEAVKEKLAKVKFFGLEDRVELYSFSTNSFKDGIQIPSIVAQYEAEGTAERLWGSHSYQFALYVSLFVFLLMFIGRRS